MWGQGGLLCLDKFSQHKSWFQGTFCVGSGLVPCSCTGHNGPAGQARGVGPCAVTFLPPLSHAADSFQGSAPRSPTFPKNSEFLTEDEGEWDGGGGKQVLWCLGLGPGCGSPLPESSPDSFQSTSSVLSLDALSWSPIMLGCEGNANEAAIWLCGPGELGLWWDTSQILSSPPP